MYALCGDNCQYCPRYIATQKGTKTALEEVKELWVRLGLRDPHFPAGNMVCHGCLPENECAYSELCACVKTRHLENCGLCHEYPCDLLSSAFNKSELLRSKASMICNMEEMSLLQKAFFSKKEYFDHIHDKHRKDKWP